MSDTSADDTLARRAQSGDRDAWAPLLERHYPALLRLCRRLLGDGHAAEDVAQEAAIGALLGVGRLREPARFGPWLLAIGANLARMELRRRHIASLEALGEPAGLVTLWSAGLPDPAEVVLTRELHDTIVGALADLSALSREALIGFYLQGYTYAELAALLNVPVRTLKGRLVFGRRRLRGRLAPLWDAPPPPPPIEKEPAMTTSDPVLVTIDSLRSSPNTNHRVVVLHESGGERLLPIWIGACEADAIGLALAGQAMPRPLTHDLSLRLLEPLGARVSGVLISRVVSNTFIAEIAVSTGTAQHRIDARPSDALALAARAGAPIHVSTELLASAGVSDPALAFTAMLGPDTPPPVLPHLLVLSANPETRQQLDYLLFLATGILRLHPPVATASELLELAAQHAPAIALLDMSDDPAALAPLVTLRSSHPGIPFVALGPASAAEAARQAGARQYLPKPAEADALYRAIFEAMLTAQA